MAKSTLLIAEVRDMVGTWDPQNTPIQPHLKRLNSPTGSLSQTLRIDPGNNTE